MKMTELNFLLSFFICGTVRSNVKVGLIESEATFFRAFFRYKNVFTAQFGSINTLKNYLQCYKPTAQSFQLFLKISARYTDRLFEK